jgi:hypothetical protein
MQRCVWPIDGSVDAVDASKRERSVLWHPGALPVCVVVKFKPSPPAFVGVLNEDPVRERADLDVEILMPGVQLVAIISSVRQAQGVASSQLFLEGFHPARAGRQVAEDRLVSRKERKLREGRMPIRIHVRQEELGGPREQEIS